MKHPLRRNSKTVILKQDTEGADCLGRITPSFRQLYKAEVARLESGQGYLNSLIDLGHRDAFGLLLEGLGTRTRRNRQF